MSTNFKSLYDCKKIVLLFFLTFPICAQIDTTALSYYPLQNGNMWQYKISSYDWSTPSWGTKYNTYLVTGDSILPNGKTYKLILLTVQMQDYTGTYYQFERIDSRYSYEYEYYIDSLYSQVGDSCAAMRLEVLHLSGAKITVLSSLEEDTVLGYIKSVKKFEAVPEMSNPFSYRLAQGIGLIDSWYTFDFGSTHDTLLYARIAGTEYGSYILNLDQSGIQATANYFVLNQNYPNPFNNRSRFCIELNQPETVEVDLYNILGQHQMRIFEGNLPAGKSYFAIDGSNLASGVYLYVARIGTSTLTKKCLLIK
jgi:hypothetical protein